MAYVTHLKPDGTYQPLKAHEENVAALAGKFAETFGAKAHGERTGLLHDIGKYSDNGQKRQRDPEHTAKVDHATAGTQLAWKLKDCVAAFAVAGHHGGLPDMGSGSDDGGGTLWARLNKPLTGGNDPSAWKNEIPHAVFVPGGCGLSGYGNGDSGRTAARKGGNAGASFGKAECPCRAVA